MQSVKLKQAYIQALALHQDIVPQKIFLKR